jgi:hypothetical protein
MTSRKKQTKYSFGNFQKLGDGRNNEHTYQSTETSHDKIRDNGLKPPCRSIGTKKNENLFSEENRHKDLGQRRLTLFGTF